MSCEVCNLIIAAETFVHRQIRSHVYGPDECTGQEQSQGPLKSSFFIIIIILILILIVVVVVFVIVIIIIIVVFVPV